MITIGLEGAYNFRGIPLTNAYARIDTVSSYDTHCTASVNIYANQEAWLKGDGYLDQVYPIYFEKEIGTIVGDDRTQGYEYVKALDQFKEWAELFNE